MRKNIYAGTVSGPGSRMGFALGCVLAALFCIAGCGVSVRAAGIDLSLPGGEASTFGITADDPALLQDCSYCHSTHNARRDKGAILNNREERYRQYLVDENGFSSLGSSAFGGDVAGKCPRSRERRFR